MVHALAPGHHPVDRLVHGLVRVAQIGRAVDQQAIAGGTAQGVDHFQPLARELGAQLLGRLICLVHRLRHAGAESDVQHVAALLEQFLKVVVVRKLVDLRCARQLSRVQKRIEPGQCLRVTAHVVRVRLLVDNVRIKNDGNPAAMHIRKGDIHRGLAREQKLCHQRSPSFYEFLARL